MNELAVKLLSAILSVVAILLVIWIINKFAKKKAEKMIAKQTEDGKDAKDKRGS